MKKMSIVRTAGKQYRLYSEGGVNLGTFAKEGEAKARMVKREYYQKHGKSRRDS